MTKLLRVNRKSSEKYIFILFATLFYNKRYHFTCYRHSCTMEVEG